MTQQVLPNADAPRRIRTIGLAIAILTSIGACVAMDDDEGDAEFRDGCDGVEEYIDQNGEEVICVYTDDPGEGGGDEYGEDEYGGDEYGGDDSSDPCWANPWLCSSDDWGDDGGYDDGGGEVGGGDDGGGGSCQNKLIIRVKDGTHATQHQARINAIEAARTQGRDDCRADSYYVGVLAYCDNGVPDNDPWSNANSSVHGCEQNKNLSWTCTAESTIFCNDYTYHAW